MKKKNNFSNKIPKLESSEDSTPSIVGMRLNKYVAHCGICSRRQAGELVKKGEIVVNEVVEINPAYQVQEGDVIKYKGKIIVTETKKVYILMNKPKDVITTVKDDRGRKTVMDIVGTKVKERIYPVGRLDRDTTGLLLLTNDGDLATKLAHPKHVVKKVYQVILDKPVKREDLQKIRNGIELEEGVAIVDGIDYVKNAGRNEIGIELHLGWNRVIRRLFEHVGYKVIRLDRTYFAGLTKKDLPRGRFRFLADREVIMLKHFI
ncbi:MAG: rRNA pseudouridine synthase [Bacteroidetes bacterium]|nr:rRNA pseudouridine synthase [Bacteroidota bacterium]MDF1863767.1 pseudouridine synthase [Saprospiraceae bacterium]